MAATDCSEGVVRWIRAQCISLLTQYLTTADICCKRTFRRSRQNYSVVDNYTLRWTPFPQHGLMEAAALATIQTFRVHQKRTANISNSRTSTNPHGPLARYGVIYRFRRRTNHHNSTYPFRELSIHF